MLLVTWNIRPKGGARLECLSHDDTHVACNRVRPAIKRSWNAPKLIGVSNSSQDIEHEVGGHNGLVIARIFRDSRVEIVVCDYLIPVRDNFVSIRLPLRLREAEFSKQSCTHLAMSRFWDSARPMSVLIPRAKNLRPLERRRISQQIHREDPERLLRVERDPFDHSTYLDRLREYY